MKKFLALILSALLVSAIFAIPVSAVEIHWAEGDYEIDPDTKNLKVSNAYGYVFDIAGVNTTPNETNTIYTSDETWKTTNGWPVSVVLENVEGDVYEVVTVYNAPQSTGDWKAAVEPLTEGQIVMMAHSSGSRPNAAGDYSEGAAVDYANWQDKVAALALKAGDKITLSGIDLAAGTATNATATVQDDPNGEATEPSVPSVPSVPVVPSVNVSAGKTYTVSQMFRQGGKEVSWGWDANAPVAYPDEDGITMTDGVIAATDVAYDDAVWAGWNHNAPEYKELGYSFITVDLGEATDITEASIYLGSSGLGQGIGCANMTVQILVSDDGKEFEVVGSAIPEDDANSSCVKTTVKFESAVNAQYVQFRMIRGGWMFVSEVEVYGPASNEGGDTDEPIVPNGSIEDSLKEKLGTAFDDAKVDYVIEAPETYKAGDEITVKVYVRNITAETGIHLTEFKLYYDNTKLLLTNDIDEENENILVCVEKAPSSWKENFSRVNNDYNEDNEEGTEVKPLNDGVIIASIFTDKTTASSAVKEDDQVIFAFTFKVLDDAEGELGFVIPHAETEAALNTKNGVEQYTANGDYAITHATVVLKGKAPTCTEDGLTDGLYCPDCGKIIVEQETIPALGHTDGEWDTTLEPTCTEAGSKDLHCAVCDAVIKTEEIAALGHTDGEWFTTVEPTEDKGGAAERRCTRCGEVLETKELPPLRLLGDVDGDRDIDKYDYLMVKRAVMDTLDLDEIGLKAADVNKNGNPDKYDYLYIKRHVLGTYVIEGTI